MKFFYRLIIYKDPLRPLLIEFLQWAIKACWSLENWFFHWRIYPSYCYRKKNAFNEVKTIAFYIVSFCLAKLVTFFAIWSSSFFITNSAYSFIILNKSRYPHTYRCESIFNSSCYQRKLILQAKTNNATLSSKPLAVTAWIDFGNNRSIRLPVVSTIFRTVDWR